MKKIFLVFAALFLFLPLRAKGESGRTLTLMIYMCGSNLESSYGSATADIQEMRNAGLDAGEVSVLVMTGGSEIAQSAGYFTSGSNCIYEIGQNRDRKIWESGEPMNMGRQETLAEFLRFGMENRPAVRYALILWDHGGGPLEGVCWDELSDMDHLTLPELTGALEDAGLPGKLSWIGFDACLMSSLEVAVQMAPYAEFMIASQETEPAFGWNYAFLNGLGQDRNGAQTGRRIVDAYFDGREDTREILTLACTDLSAVGDVVAAMDQVFLPISQRMDREQYLSLSGLRMHVTGFGKSAPDLSDSGYDLVDLRDLVSGLEPTEASENLLSQLDGAVVYHRSNEDGAGGLALYHPYANGNSYREKWGEAYRQLSFSQGYQEYVEAFGQILTGEMLFRWLDLIPRASEPEPDGVYPFEMQLTEEQAENMVSAQLMILTDQAGDTLDQSCVLLTCCPAELGPDRVLRGSWDGRILYAEAEPDSQVEVTCCLTDDAKYNVITGLYTRGEYIVQEQQEVLFELDAADRSEYPEIVRVLTLDEATGSFTTRNAFSEDGFNSVNFWHVDRYFPDVGADRTLPRFEEWEQNNKRVAFSQLRLPVSWCFHYREKKESVQYYAVFRILDSQQHVVCSLPAAVPNPYRSGIYQGFGTASPADPVRAALSVTVNTAPETMALQLNWEFENQCGRDVKIRIDDLTVNDSRSAEFLLSRNLAAGESARRSETLERYALTFLDTLESISGTLEISFKDSGDEEAQSIPFRYEFTGCDLSAISHMAGDVLAETERDGVTLKLLEIVPDSWVGWNLILYEEQTGSVDLPGMDVLLNGIHVSGLMSRLPAGMSRVEEIRISNDVETAGRMFLSGTQTSAIITLEDNILLPMEIRELQEIRLVPYASEGPDPFVLTLSSPYSLGEVRRSRGSNAFVSSVRPPEDLPFPREEDLPVLADSNLCRIRLRRVMAGLDHLYLTLEWTNLTDSWLEFRCDSVEIDGKSVDDLFAPQKVPPQSTYVTYEVLDVGAAEPDAETEFIRSLDFSFSFTGSSSGHLKRSFRVQLRTEKPLLTGQDGGVWINGEDFSSDAVRQELEMGTLDPEIELNPRIVNETVQIPEDPALCRTVLEVELDPEEAARVKSCMVSVGRMQENEYWQVLTFQPWKPDGSGKWEIPLCGLFPAFAGQPQTGILTLLAEGEDGTWSGETRTRISFYTNDYIFLEHVCWTLDPAAGSALVTSFSETGEGTYSRQSDLRSADVATYPIWLEPDENGLLPHLADAEIDTSFEWFLKTPSFQLNDIPLQLALRPIEPEDQCSVLFSVVTEDGRSYSLPLIPYPFP